MARSHPPPPRFWHGTGFQPCASAGQRRYDVLILVKRGVPVVGWWEVGFPSLMYRRCIGVSIEVATAATAAAGKKPAAGKTPAAGSGAAALQVPGSAALKYGGCTPPVTPEIARKSSKSPKKKAAGAGAGAAAATAATTTIVQIATVHLESSKGGAKYRAKQLDRLAEELGRDSAGNIQSNTTTVVCGDMNLCSSWKDENERIAVGYTDCWPTVHETLGNVELARAGYTEDSSVNTMRYQVKLEHKKVRFDRILIKHWGGGAATTAAHAPAKRFSCKQHGPLCGSASCKESTAAAAAAALAKAPPKPKPVKPAGCWQPQSIHILGTKELCSAAAALAGGYQRSRKKELSVFPSDHFGLATALQFNPD